MRETICIYCDESCHLENDGQQVMVLGALWGAESRKNFVAQQIKGLKIKHGLSPNFEIKWTKVSPSKADFYRDLLDFFFDCADVNFRAIIAKKDNLRHSDFRQDHDSWYYKMYFDLIKIILAPVSKYKIYADIKDTHSGERMNKLRNILSNNMYDFNRDIIVRIQPVRSNDVQQIQLVDFLIGIVCYANRKLASSSIKLELVETMKNKSGYNLLQSTLYREDKVNLFLWKGVNQ